MARARTQEEEVFLKLTQQVSGPAAQARVAAAQLDEAVTGSVGALKAMQDAARVESLGALEAQIVKASGSLKELQAQMRALQKGPSVDIEQYRSLKGSIDQQTTSLAKLKGEHSALAGFAKKAGKDAEGGAKAGAAGLDAASKAARLLGGQAGASAASVATFGKELLALGPYALAAGVALAVLAAGVVALVGFFSAGLKASDAFRNELLQLQGAMRGNAEAGKQAQSAINAVASSAFNALPREKLAAYAQQLGVMRLRGRELQVALEGAAIAGSASGDAAAQAFIGGAAGARQFAGGVDALTARIKRQLGGVAASQAYSLDAQIRRMKESVTSLFAGRNIDPFLSGLKNITDMFSQNTEFGEKLHQAVGRTFDKLLAVATKALPYVKGGILGAAIAGATMYLFALDIYDAIAKWAEPIIKSTGLFDDATIAIKAGEAAAYVLTGTFLAMGSAVLIAMLPIVVVIGSIGLAIYAVIAVVAFLYDVFTVAADTIVWAFRSAKEALSGFSLADIATNMVNTFIETIAGSVGRVGAALANLGSAAKAGLKEALGIHSPSRFAQETADNVTGTFTGRVEDAAPDAAASFKNFADPVSVKSEAKGGRASGNATILYVEKGAFGGGDESGSFDKFFAMARERLDAETYMLEAPA